MAFLGRLQYNQTYREYCALLPIFFMEAFVMSHVSEHLKTLVKLNGFALGVMHISNKCINSYATGKNLLKPGGGKEFNWRNDYIFYHKYGNGDPVILLHDLDPAFSSYEWNEAVDELCSSRTVYSVDLPGCGRSSKPKKTFTNNDYVQFLTEFIKGVVKETCTVIASGYSSSFALVAAVSHPNMIGQVIAINPRGLHDLMQTSSGRSKAAATLISLPIIGTSVYNMSESKGNIDLRFTEKYFYNPFHSKTRYIDAFYESAHYNESRGKYLMASIEGKTTTVDITAALKETGEKLVILYGEKAENADRIAESYQKINPSVQAYPIAGTGSLPQLESPAKFVSALAEVW